MTSDDSRSHGKTPAELFPAQTEILQLCNLFRQTRNPKDLLRLPKMTGAPYEVSLYKSEELFGAASRDSYFRGIERKPNTLIFLDPDNGFEPGSCLSKKHVAYEEVEQLLKSISPDNAISVFQYHRRKKFADDFAEIRRRRRSGYATALYWHSVMFVTVASRTELIVRIMATNEEYARDKPVEVIV